MGIHTPRPLPDPKSLPYGLVAITVWEPTPGIDHQWSGKSYTSSGDVWRSTRGSLDSELKAGEVVDWSFDGYRFDYFNRGYLLESENDPGPLVRLAMWALDRWAVNKGLKESVDKASIARRYSP